MVQLHCPRCELVVPMRGERATLRVCPRCAASAKLAVPLAAVATITRGDTPRGPAPA